MNISRNPDSQRGPQLARRAKATAEGIRTLARPRRDVDASASEPRSTRSSSPTAESTFSGSRIAQIVATTKTAKPNRSDHSGPMSESAPAIGAETVAPTVPASDTRPLARTSVKDSGRRRGTAAALVTPYALEETRTPSAAANSQGESPVTDVASAQQRKARIDIVAPIAHRRPWANRSRNGPISGATIAKGSIVSPRKSATWPRASPEGTWKNSEPASEIATAVSPAALKKCIWISRDSPDSPAPSASDARVACWTV